MVHQCKTCFAPGLLWGARNQTLGPCNHSFEINNCKTIYVRRNSNRFVSACVCDEKPFTECGETVQEQCQLKVRGRFAFPGLDVSGVLQIGLRFLSLKRIFVFLGRNKSVIVVLLPRAERKTFVQGKGNSTTQTMHV